MPADNDISQPLQEAVREAHAAKQALEIRAGASKRFYGRRTEHAEVLDVSAHRGIVAYDPTELAITVRSGTVLETLEQQLLSHRQQLPFEPPAFGPTASIGGTVACGLSGPRRPYAGALRDALLGVKLINGRGEILEFGGRVMKNVAGYDVSRLMAGALGTLGVLLEVSLKLQPCPAAELTLRLDCDADTALEHLWTWTRRPLPISAAAHDTEALYLRLAGDEAAVDATRAITGGEVVEAGDAFWASLREHRHPFFAGEAPLWRLSLPPAAPRLTRLGDMLMEWGGAQRWLRSEAGAERIREVAVDAGGHATLFRGGARDTEVFHPPAPGLMALHRRLKQAFDPAGLFNPGRLYSNF